MNCRYCAYHYPDIDPDGHSDGIPYCHYYYNDGLAPCEVAEEEHACDED